MGGNGSSQGHQGVALARPHLGEAPAGRGTICSGDGGKLDSGRSSARSGSVLGCTVGLTGGRARLLGAF